MAYQNDGDYSSADQSASDPGMGNREGAYVPTFKNQSGPQSGDFSQSAPTSGGEYGSTGYPGNMTDAGSMGQSGGAAGASGFDAGAIGGPTPSSGDFSQSAPSSDNSYGNTGYPGDQSDLSGMQNSGAGTSGSGQAGFVDRARGGLEQAAGRVTGNEDLAQRGQQRTQGNF